MLEFTNVVVPMDDQQQAKLDELSKQGYILVPGTVPQAIYMLCRPVQAQAAQQPATAPEPQMMVGAGFGKLGFDESKIYILRDGKYLDVDGNEVQPQLQ